MAIVRGAPATLVKESDASRVIAPDASEAAGVAQCSSRVTESNQRPAGDSPNMAECKTAGLIFEMANVLYDATLWWRWFSTLLARVRPQARLSAFESQWNEEYLPHVCRGHREFGEALESFLQRAGLGRGEIDELSAAGLARRRDLEFEVLPFPGVKRTLQRLHRQGIKLAAVSDSANTSGELTERLTRLGLGNLFSVVLSSVELERIKPDRLPYETAVRRLGLAKRAVCFVGQADADLAGARDVGLRTIAIQSSPGAPADNRVARFDALWQVAVHGGSAILDGSVAAG